MHRVAIGLSTLLLLAGTPKQIAADESPAAKAAAQLQAAQADQLCVYCENYTIAAMAAGPITTADQVGVGNPDERQVHKSTSARPSDGKPARAQVIP